MPAGLKDPAMRLPKAPATLAMQSPVQNLTSAQSAPSPRTAHGQEEIMVSSPFIRRGSEEPGKSSNDGGVLIWILPAAYFRLLLD